MSQTITRLFDDFSDARHAVAELERIGIPHSDISLVAHKAGAGADYGDVNVREPRTFTASEAAVSDAAGSAASGAGLGAVGGALAGIGLVTIPGLGPVVAAGWLASAVVGAVVGGVVAGSVGGVVAALTQAGVSEDEANVYAESVRRGSALVTAKVDDDKVAAAEAALNSTTYVNMDERKAAFQAEGWAAFDPTAPAYTEADIERARRGSAADLPPV